MTVLAYRNGILAADRLIWLGSGAVAGECRKITRLKSGGLVAVAGSQSTATLFPKWLEDKSQDTPKVVSEHGFRAIEIAPDGVVTLWDELLQPTTYEAEFYVAGCRAAFTLGALYAGASAEEAVRLTLRYTDVGSSDNAVDVVHLKQPANWSLGWQ